MGARGSLLAATAVVVGAIACWWVTREDPDPAEPAQGAGAESAQQVQSRAAPSSTRTSARRRATEDTASDDADADARDAALADARVKRESILTAVAEGRWNDAMKGLNELDAKLKDAAIREAIGFDALQAQVMSGRDRWFSERIGGTAFATMDELIAAKTRDSTLAAARAWASRELDAQMWEKVRSDLGLNADELANYWKSRRVAEPRRSTYGAGSFVVLRPQFDHASPAAAREAEAADALADEDWWCAASVAERGAFLASQFVETSGRFEILRTDNVDCDACHGRSCFERTAPDGGVTRVPCATCNGCGAVRSVTYR